MYNWEDQKGWFVLSLSRGAAIVEPVSDGRWFWQIDKSDDANINWTDDTIYELDELPGWWGFKSTLEAAQLAAEDALYDR